MFEKHIEMEKKKKTIVRQTMNALLLSLQFLAIVNAQLSVLQHSALMNFYDEIGCSASVCIRFPKDSDCPLASDLTCKEPDVLGM
jgi:hypothetical protein